MSDEDLDYPLLPEEEFRNALARLNAICGLGYGWQKTTAIKKHVDEFGVEIKRGENYYKRQHWASFSAVLKLSHRSMDKLLNMTIYTCTTLEQLGDLLLEEQRAKFMAIRDRQPDHALDKK